MSKLEDLVPPPELFRQIPPGQFEDSAFLYAEFTFRGKRQKIIQRSIKNAFAQVYRNDGITFCPAPTLAEILYELSKTYTLIDAIQQVDGEWHVSGWKTPVKLDKNPVIAALRLFLEVYNAESDARLEQEAKDD